MKSLISSCVCLFLFPVFAEAQSSPRIDLRTAFGVSNYLHADLDFNAPTTLVAMRFGGDYVAIEPEFAYAWHTRTQTFTGTPIGTVTQTSERKFQSLGVNLVGGWPGRVSSALPMDVRKDRIDDTRHRVAGTDAGQRTADRMVDRHLAVSGESCRSSVAHAFRTRRPYGVAS